MEIIVKIKNVYGNKTIYPVCEQSKLFAQMAGTTTLTRESIDLIKLLGYEISIQAETL